MTEATYFPRDFPVRRAWGASQLPDSAGTLDPVKITA